MTTFPPACRASRSRTRPDAGRDCGQQSVGIRYWCRRFATENPLCSSVASSAARPDPPPSLPTLYPGLDPLRLEQFLTDEDYARIKAFDNVYVLPFASRTSRPNSLCFGLGLSRLMIRNLMLLPDLSIHGPEDTAEVFCEGVGDVAAAHPRSAHVSGVAERRADGYALRVEVHRPGRPTDGATVAQADFRAFVRACSVTLARLLGSAADERLLQLWDVARPRAAASLVQLGELHLDYERRQLAERARAARRLLGTDPDCVIAAWDIDEELPGARDQFLEGLQRDPYNAQLCLATFCAVWTSKGPQPEALQFCRKAIELSPGHGKAHMRAPHAAQRPAGLLRHSELGYRLLPGNSFAVNNYTLALERAGAPAAQRIALAQEGITADPRDPGSYLRLIELCVGLGEYRTALEAAERRQHLFEPQMDERALYCLRQNPQMAKLIDSGAYDPAADNRRRIEELRRHV